MNMLPSIRVLIVEDQPQKTAQVVNFLQSLDFCDVGQVEVAESGIQARQILRDKTFDLMILDVVLPNRPEDRPHPEGGVELLREIMSRQRLKRPHYIVGLTAYPEVFQSAAADFVEFTWAVVQYNPEDSSWRDPIAQLCRHIARAIAATSESTSSYATDICVVAALKEEFSALCDLDFEWQRTKCPGDATEYYAGSALTMNETVTVVAACASRMGMISAAVLAANMIRTFRPRIIVSIGLCAGVRDRVGMGDVVVADPSWDYQSGKFTGKDFEFAPHQLPIHSAIRKRIAALDSAELQSDVAKRWSKKPVTENFQLHIGPFASGSAVMADKTKLESLRLQHRNLVAIDMEVYGIYSAASDSPMPSPYPLAIKGISDFADETKNDSHREFACFASARVFNLFVRQEYLAVKKILWA
jgi:nucleoside phosphorylase/CheY-like chemotaxis protein